MSYEFTVASLDRVSSTPNELRHASIELIEPPTPRRYSPLGLEQWPGKERRMPPIARPDYLHLRALVASLRQAIERELGQQRALHVLDLGCGYKPYFPLFQPFVASYIGVDPQPEVSTPDSVAIAEGLPFPNRAFDVVVSTQAFGYVSSPDGALREIKRVLRGGGLAIISTHGTYPYIADSWRFTGSGLRRLFEQAGFQQIRVEPNGGPLLCLWQMSILLLDAFTGYGRRIPRWASAPAFVAANLVGQLLNKIDGDGTKFCSMNYTVSARKP
jgi:SAM-dependent methyltransferase